MHPRLARLVSDERGMSLIFAGVGLSAFLACTAIAIDVGEFMTARAQAQNSADAGALAGATALAFDDYNDRSPSGPAVTNGIQGALSNRVLGSTVSVNSGDVSFPSDPATGLNDRVKVNVYRTSGRGNAIPTWMGRMFGVKTVNIDASATAEASPANAGTCLMPWMVPDKWIENQTPPFDPGDTFNRYQKNGNTISIIPNPDVYTPGGPNGGGTGYRPQRQPYGDIGWEVTLKPGNPSQATAPSMYYAIDLIRTDTQDTGASRYYDNIVNCNSDIVTVGDMMVSEPGNMEGPTLKGVQDLLDRDPNAFWDDARQKVVSSMRPSPRIVNMALFDPDAYDYGRQTGRLDLKVANIVGFFLENLDGKSVTGRMIRAPGVRKRIGPINGNSFLTTITLVQ